MSQVTIREIAKKLNVSKMTVSRVINNSPGVSEERRKQIQEAIKEMGYIPNAKARSLARGRSNLIGVFVPDIYSEWISPLFLGIGEEANHSDFQILLRSTGYGMTFTHEESHFFVDSGLVDGVIVASWLVSQSYIKKISRKRIPVVVIDGFKRTSKISWISCQDNEGAIEAVKHLASLGHKKIAFIGGGEKSYLGKQRLEGFLEGVKLTGLQQEDIIVEHGDLTLESGKNVSKKILTQENLPTAVFAASDPMAIGVLQTAHEMDLHIPDDLSVIGFDDTLANAAIPPLTTIKRDYTRMGKTAVRILLDQIKGNFDTQAIVQIDLPTELVVRQSTKRIS